ncbi:MAG: RNA polymerase sigma factor [Planctomycetota bacterium]|nr:RNA polymerase sigma factor [Planctomycetota bacterium]
MSPTPDLPDELWEIVEQYRGELVNQALAMLGSLEDAEDVVQETFCEAFRSRERIAEARSLGAWLRSINRANAMDHLRKRRRGRQAPRPGRTFTTGGFSLIEMRESLAKAIEALPEDQRSIVVLRYWEHLSYDEIAARLQLPTTTVWRRFYEASVALFGRMQDKLEAPAPDPRDPS